MILFNLFVIGEMWLKLGSCGHQTPAKGVYACPHPDPPPWGGSKILFRGPSVPEPQSRGSAPGPDTIGILKGRALKVLLGYAVPTFYLWAPKGTPLVKGSRDRRSPESNDHSLPPGEGQGGLITVGPAHPTPPPILPLKGPPTATKAPSHNRVAILITPPIV